jgi:hypothetical protein
VRVPVNLLVQIGLVVMSLCSGNLLQAQQAAVVPANRKRTITLHHGDSQVSTMWLENENGGLVHAVPATWLLSPGTSVCVRVPNANPAFYQYSLSAIVDSAAIRTSMVSGLSIDVLKKALGIMGAQPLAAASLEGVDPESYERPRWLARYASQLGQLRATILTGESIAKQSENAEPMASPFSPAPLGGKGYAWARDSLRSLIPLGTLEENLAAYHKLAKDSAALYMTAPQPSTDETAEWAEANARFEEYKVWSSVALEALKAYGDALAQQAKVLLGRFNAPAVWESCKEIGPDPELISLQIRRTEKGDPLRRVGDQSFRISASPRYDWKTVNLTTGPILIYSSGARSFSTKGDTIAVEDDRVRVRGSAGILVHLTSFGAIRDRSLSVMVGIGALDASSSTSRLVDGLVGAMVRIRDDIGVGAGIGWATRPTELRLDLEDGSTLPPGAKLENLVRNRQLFSFFITVQGKLLGI